MRKAPLPADLGDSFSVSAARARGVSASRLRAHDLVAPFHAVRAATQDVAATGERMLLERARQYANRMTSHEFFSHVVAAVIWGVPLPHALVADHSLDVAVLWPRRAPSGRGVRGHALRDTIVRTTTHPRTGLPVSSPASTWAMLAASYPRLEDAVVAADALVRVPLHPDDPPALATLAQLHSAATAGRRIGGSVLLEALPLVSQRSRSRPETLLRLLLAGAGLPDPRVNADVFHRGVWLAQVDLAFPEHRVALEYEGEHHLTDPAQWAADIVRMERLVEAGWRVIRVTKADLFQHPDALIARVRRALAAA